MIDTNKARRPLSDSLISLVLPLYNESAALERLVGLIRDALDACGCRFEIVFVNDGSHDGSAELLDRLADADARIHVVHFSRHFGHQAAVQAGLDHAGGDAIIVMDSDMQDNPRAIASFLDRWQDGFDVVFATREKRKEGLIKRMLFYGFYRILNLISDIPIPNDAGNFGLIDRRVADCIVALNDCDRFYPGLRRWVGFRQTSVVVERLARHDETPRVSMCGLFRLAKSAVFSFSTAPLTMFYGIAALSAVVCLGSMAFVLYHRLFSGLAIPGWTSTIITGSFFGMLNALGISILGEYVMRIYDQVRARPPYIVARKRNFHRQPQHSPDRVLEWVNRQWDGPAITTEPGMAEVFPLCASVSSVDQSIPGPSYESEDTL